MGVLECMRAGKCFLRRDDVLVGRSRPAREMGGAGRPGGAATTEGDEEGWPESGRNDGLMLERSRSQLSRAAAHSRHQAAGPSSSLVATPGAGRRRRSANVLGPPLRPWGQPRPPRSMAGLSPLALQVNLRARARRGLATDPHLVASQSSLALRETCWLALSRGCTARAAVPGHAPGRRGSRRLTPERQRAAPPAGERRA